ncbi:cupin domain-containing protein [Ascidiaceihabitans sp.]|uniref:cupin domain-containing protein n=1 Tax=Ascidiaceihabitans sp. TaxID=1872644 RepID=UPI003298FD2B
MCDAPPQGTALAHAYIENERTRVTEWRFPKRGDNTGWHRHAYDYVVVPLFDGQLDILGEDGARTLADMKTGVPYFRELGVAHDVINANDFECAFIEIEFLEQPKP